MTHDSSICKPFSSSESSSSALSADFVWSVGCSGVWVGFGSVLWVGFDWLVGLGWFWSDTFFSKLSFSISEETFEELILVFAFFKINQTMIQIYEIGPFYWPQI